MLNKKESNTTHLYVFSRGSAIAKVVGNNVKTLDEFETEINMWVFEENINGRKLTEIINEDHENVKYLPGHKIPDNVVRLDSIVSVYKLAETSVKGSLTLL